MFFQKLVLPTVHRPRYFGETYDPNIDVDYYHKRRAWMTSDVFTTWLRGLDPTTTQNNSTRRQRSELQHTIQRATMHRSPTLPAPNTTARIQPQDAGIIKTFKTCYQNNLSCHFIDCTENDNPQTVNVNEALHMMTTAWASVTEKTINNCFRHVDIIPQLRRSDPTKHQLLSPTTMMTSTTSHSATFETY